MSLNVSAPRNQCRENKANYASFASTNRTKENDPLAVTSADDDPPPNLVQKQNDLLMELSESIRNSQPCHRHRRQHYNLAREKFGQPSQDTIVGAYECAVTTSVLIYWIFVSLIPVYNKFFFQNSLFPYPIATAGIQLAVVSLVLALLNTLQHCCWHVQCGLRRQPDLDPPLRSWIFGPHFFWKVQWCFPIGFLFGVKYGVTNLGLHLISAPTHLLLQSTDLVWTVLGAWWINGEVINATELLCLIGCVSGSLVLGWQVSEDQSVAAPLFAILINLISPMLLGLCISTLRLACVELMRPDNRVAGTVSSVELTSIKLMMSSSVALISACILEGGREEQQNWKDEQHQISWWAAFAALPSSTKWGVIGGAGLIAVFQANCTFLTFLTNAVAVGLCGQVKIIPQWITATIFATKASNFTVKPTAIIGAFLICGSAATFSYSNWREWSEEEATISDGDVTLLEVSEDDPDNEMAPMLKASSSRSSVQPHRHNHHPPHLYADADQWGDASIRSAFNEIGDRIVQNGTAFNTTLIRRPSISSNGNLAVFDSPPHDKR
jgi:hypothetical protein